MASRTTIYPWYQWVTVSMTGVIVLIANAVILKKELTKRNSGLATLTTKYMKMWSILTLSCGPIIGFITAMQYFDGFCYFFGRISLILKFIQPIFLGFYQLSRLYYCFAKDQVHSTKGYPNWLFITMYIFGIFIIINVIIYIFFEIEHPIHCGLNHGGYKFKTSQSVSLSSFVRLIWFLVYVILFIFWDLFTFALYLYKVRSFRKYKAENKIIYNRILSILYRIMILTLFYQIMSVFISILIVIVLETVYYENYEEIGLILNEMLSLLPSILFCYTMYLMMDHNTMEYTSFIKCIYFTKFHWICFCFKGIISHQFEQLVMVELPDVNSNSERNHEIPARITKTEYDDNDISKDHGKITMDGVELSVETQVRE